MSEKVRESVRFFGRVQGVGFRYKLTKLAGYYGLTGWVRNEYDGTVSAEMQGREEEIGLILQALGEDRYIRIDRIERKKIESDLEERGFRERY